MDAEAILERVEAKGQGRTFPVLVTSRIEIEETCVEAGRRDLARAVATMPDDGIEYIARKLGDRLMDGADYWEAIPVIVDAAVRS